MNRIDETDTVPTLLESSSRNDELFVIFVSVSVIIVLRLRSVAVFARFLIVISLIIASFAFR